MSKPVFVFGSNRAGRHGAGAASYARRYCGAVVGQGEGRQGNSYAIPTKDRGLRSLPLYDIEKSVRVFLNYAAEHPGERFQVTAIGCGLAGYKPEQIGPMFQDAPDNCELCEEFRPYRRLCQDEEDKGARNLSMWLSKRTPAPAVKEEKFISQEGDTSPQ